MSNIRHNGSFTRRSMLGLGLLAVNGRTFALAPSRNGVSTVSKGKGNPLFKLGRIQVVDPKDPMTSDLPPPRIEILQPASNAELVFGKPVTIVVGLTIPPGGQLPTFVVVGVKKDDTYYGTFNAHPEGKQGSRYTLEREFKIAPNQPMAGVYELEVEVIYVYQTAEPDGSRKNHKTTRLHKRIPVQFQLGR